ncbi:MULTISPECIES: hypothetical protein [Pannonibacter]|uniref:hypothetical protein n=1 Tax=Pannonibacter TaxID=227873 RepID=UPI0013CED812|nr:hypothetical protein [Pannonibacter phragmitetus]
MRISIFAGLLASAMSFAFNNAARAEPDIAIRDAARINQQNLNEVKKAAKGDPGVDAGAKELAKEITKRAAGIKPSHPVAIFFKVLVKPKPAY